MNETNSSLAPNPLCAGDPAPDFTLESDSGESVTLSALLADLAGRGMKGLILYFYPKDSTSGCTTEAAAFRDSLDEFKRLGWAVSGVSRDSVKSHCNFRDKQALTFPLLSDREQTACRLYDVLKEKTMYGRKCFGVERSTFVIGADGLVRHVLRGVKAKTHVAELIALLSA